MPTKKIKGSTVKDSLEKKAKRAMVAHSKPMVAHPEPMVAHRGKKKSGMVAQSKSRRKETILTKAEALDMLTSAAWYAVNAGIEIKAENTPECLVLFVSNAQCEIEENKFNFVLAN